MLERFSAEAREAVRAAQEEVRRGTGRARRSKTMIGPEHVLLGLLAAERGPAAQVLRAHGVTAERVRERLAGRAGGLDAQALATLGIDLDAVRRSAEASFGPGALDAVGGRGHIPFSTEAKRVLELALRAAVRMGHRGITSGHVLLGVLRQDNSAAVRALLDLDVDVAGLDAEVIALISDKAA